MPWPRTVLASAAALVIGLGPLAAQAQLPRPPQVPSGEGSSAPKPGAPAPDTPQVAPPRPYKPVAVTLPKPLSDASFEAFRKELGDAATKKDKAALANLVAPKFFQLNAEGEDKADPKKSGLENLVEILDLDGSDQFGWDALLASSRDPTADPLPQRKGVMCAPGGPSFDDDAFQKLLQTTDTDEFEWGYTATPQVEVRSGTAASAPVTEKLGPILVRILPEADPNAAPPTPPVPGTPPAAVPVATPSGKTGYVSAAAVRPLTADQICYVKDNGSWKLAGYLGAE